MSSQSVRLKQKEYKKAIGMLKELAEKIIRGELEVVSSGFWMEGTPDRHTFQFHVIESKKYENSENV